MSVQNVSVILEMCVSAVKGRSASGVNVHAETFVNLRTATVIALEGQHFLHGCDDRRGVSSQRSLANGQLLYPAQDFVRISEATLSSEKTG